MAEWLEICVSVEDELLEIAAGLLDDLVAGGVVIEDPSVISEYAARTHPDEWGIPEQEYADKQPVLKAYLAVDELTEERYAQICRLLSGLGLDVVSRMKTKKVRDEDWATAWQAYYKPVRVGQRMVIKPSWEEWSAADGDLVVVMDPGMAFGCGTHATTVLCLELLEKYLKPGNVVFDAGTGTGILAIAAAKLGAGEVLATDIDLTACRVAQDNVRRNQADNLVQIVHGNLLDMVGDRKAQLIVANIIADVIITIAPDVRRLLVPGGLFIASGIIAERLDHVRSVLEENGMTIGEQRGEGHWVALVASNL